MTAEPAPSAPHPPEPTVAHLRLSGKRAVVVGAGQTPGATVGIGRAYATLFARAGAQLLLVDRDPGSLDETLSMIRSDGFDATTCVADITVESDVTKIAETAVQALGGVDSVTNVVGILGAGDATTVSETYWDRVMDVNLKGGWLVCKHLLPRMRAQGTGGSVTLMSSGASLGGWPTTYVVSKAGVNALAVSLACANAQFGIRVNAVLPGFMDTPMAVEHNATALKVDRWEHAAARAAALPFRYQGSAYDVTQACLFLASDEGRYISGAILPVDGALLVSTGQNMELQTATGDAPSSL